MVGTLRVPAILFRYLDSPPIQYSRDPSQYDATLFGAAPPGGKPYTLRTFYEQMSNQLFSIQGQSAGWVPLSGDEIGYTGGQNCAGLNPYFGYANCNGFWSAAAFQAMQTGLIEALTGADASVAFGQFDNDGLDGIPNSGDDDGVVDAVLFLHASKDGACVSSTNNHLWPHRYFLSYTTNDPAAGGGNIAVRDYILQSGLGGPGACDEAAMMPIGTAAHELGHILALPDLYDVGGPTNGIGEWGLMGSGNYTTPESPSRYDAWSLQQMGWATIRPLTADGNYGVGTEPTADTILFVNVQGLNPRNEYYLIENRQASQADTALIRDHCQFSGDPPGCAGGLLIWHIDGIKACLLSLSCPNTVNHGFIHGVVLEEADGLRQLWCQTPLTCGHYRGDAGDPYPGTSGNTAFSSSTNPPAIKNSDAGFVGFAIESIQQNVPNGEMSFQLRFIQPTQVAITTQPGGAVSGWPFTQQPVVELRDANNQPVALSGVVVTAAIASGSGALIGASPAGSTTTASKALARVAARALATVTATTDANGVATFRNLIITGTGPHTLSFTAPDLPIVTSANFIVSQPVATVLENNVPVTGLGGAVNSTQFYVITLPIGVPQLTVSISGSGNTGDADLYVRQGDFPQYDQTLELWNCRPYLTGNAESCPFPTPAAGNWYIALHGFEGYLNVTLVAQYTTSATHLALNTPPGGAVSGEAFTQQPVVELRDGNDEPVTNAGVEVTVVKESGSGTLSGSTGPPLTATTDANGQATFAGLTITGTGAHSLTFSAPNLTEVTSASFDVASGAPTQLAMITQPEGAVSGVAFTQQPVVELRDANNLSATHPGVVVTVVKGSGSGTLSGSTSPPLTATTDGNGRATFAGLTITGTGAHTLTFSAPNLTEATSQSFTVSAGALIVLSPSGRSFLGTQNGSVPGSQTVSVTNGGGGVLDGLGQGAITYGGGPTGWLTVSVNPTTAPATVTLQPNVTSMAPGTYTATVPVIAAVASNSPQSITVAYDMYPSVHLSDVTCGLLGSCQPSPGQIAYVDGIGNRNGHLDLGDLVAWIDMFGGSVDVATMNQILSRTGR
jgi:M6 family metalloprotease-like protein